MPEGDAFQTFPHSTVSQLLLPVSASIESSFKHKDPDDEIGVFEFYFVLREMRCILTKVLMTIRVIDRPVGFRNGQIPRSRLTISPVVCTRNHEEVAHFMDECASL